MHDLIHEPQARPQARPHARPHTRNSSTKLIQVSSTARTSSTSLKHEPQARASSTSLKRKSHVRPRLSRTLSTLTHPLDPYVRPRFHAGIEHAHKARHAGTLHAHTHASKQARHTARTQGTLHAHKARHAVTHARPHRSSPFKPGVMSQFLPGLAYTNDDRFDVTVDSQSFVQSHQFHHTCDHACDTENCQKILHAPLVPLSVRGGTTR
jgi:hypothetical protein